MALIKKYLWLDFIKNKYPYKPPLTTPPLTLTSFPLEGLASSRLLTIEQVGSPSTLDTQLRKCLLASEMSTIGKELHVTTH